MQSRVGVDSWEATDWPRREVAHQGRAKAAEGGGWSVSSWMLARKPEEKGAALSSGPLWGPPSGGTA